MLNYWLGLNVTQGSFFRIIQREALLAVIISVHWLVIRFYNPATIWRYCGLMTFMQTSNPYVFFYRFVYDALDVSDSALVIGCQGLYLCRMLGSGPLGRRQQAVSNVESALCGPFLLLYYFTGRCVLVLILTAQLLSLCCVVCLDVLIVCQCI